MSTRRVFAEDRRLVTLRILDEAGGELSDSLLLKGLKVYGHKPGRDLLREDLAWLADQELIAQEELPRPSGSSEDPLIMVSLLRRGQEVAQGDIQVMGVAKPSRRR